MKVTTEPSSQHCFTAHGWCADDYLSVLRILRRQLVAASALWPDLAAYQIEVPAEAKAKK